MLVILNKSIWPIDGTLTSTTNPCEGGPGSNDNERVYHTSQISRTEDAVSDTV